MCQQGCHHLSPKSGSPACRVCKSAVAGRAAGLARPTTALLGDLQVCMRATAMSQLQRMLQVCRSSKQCLLTSACKRCFGVRCHDL